MTDLTPDQIAASRDQLLAEGFHPDSKAVRVHEQLLAAMQDHPRHTEAACQSMEDLKAECERLREALAVALPFLDSSGVHAFWQKQGAGPDHAKAVRTVREATGLQKREPQEAA